MNNRFSENLRKIRKENNLSQEQFADKLGVSRQAISKWESATAYPEMDKIISLCDKFNLNIDDLLHKDIREVKGEEESKKKINNWIEDFLSFITDTINLFSNMSFKSKIKCLFEQLVIIIILFIISLIMFGVINLLLQEIIRILPNGIEMYANNILESILIIFFLVSSTLILTRIFKVRYLDYYNKIKKGIRNQDNSKEDIIENNNKKIIFKNNENKFIIRDPKDSEYNFINSLFKLIILIIKFFVSCCILFVSFILVCLFITFILSFLIYKTGIFFIGILIMILSSSLITIIILLLLLNFVFDRKNDKKKMIWSFIVSLIFLGIGTGIMLSGILNFEILEYNEDTKIETIEYKMEDNLIIFPNMYSGDTEYIEEDIDNVKIEYTINNACDVTSYKQDNRIRSWGSCSNMIKISREFIYNINNKKIISTNNEIKKITVYASKENIKKLKDNLDNYYQSWN